VVPEPSQQPSRRRRRLARTCGSILGMILVVATLSLVAGVLIGVLGLASTDLPAGVQRVIGIVLLIISLLSGGTALIFIAWWLESRRAARSPRRELRVFQPLPQGRAFQVSGTIVSAPLYLAPISLRPCVLWFIALRRYQATSSSEEASMDWVAVWGQSRMADVEIHYDRTRTIHMRPDGSQHENRVTESPGGTIPGEAIRMARLPSDGQRILIFPPTAANLQILDSEGLPPKLHEESTSRPNAYQVAEYALTTGDFVTGHQQSATASEDGLLDPNAPFEMSTYSREHGNVQVTGCLAGAFIMGGLLLLLFGVMLLHR